MNAYTADVYILWGEYHKQWWRGGDNRVYHEGKPQTFGLTLRGRDRAEAAKTLSDSYEFMRDDNGDIIWRD